MYIVLGGLWWSYIFNLFSWHNAPGITLSLISISFNLNLYPCLMLCLSLFLGWSLLNTVSPLYALLANVCSINGSTLFINVGVHVCVRVCPLRTWWEHSLSYFFFFLQKKYNKWALRPEGLHWPKTTSVCHFAKINRKEFWSPTLSPTHGHTMRLQLWYIVNQICYILLYMHVWYALWKKMPKIKST